MQFKWRNHDPALGRFFNVDPLAADYVYNSPYAFSENHVTAHVELEGLEKSPYQKPGAAPGGASYSSTSSKSQRKYTYTVENFFQDAGSYFDDLINDNYGINTIGSGPIGDDSYARKRKEGMTVDYIDMNFIEIITMASGKTRLKALCLQKPDREEKKLQLMM